MSSTVDSRIVEMQFNNQQFETNAKKSIDTLNELNKSLDLKDSAKGLTSIGDAANSSTRGIGNLLSVASSIGSGFSAGSVMAITAISNITNAALNAATKIAKEFTIEPIIAGFNEYETQLNSVQTILANTSSKGTTLDDVNAALDTLNTYADKTIYNFTEMTRNIGTFTAAGIDLDTSVSAIQGIANLAAVSGSSSTQASTAMYQLSQALASGTVRLMDWNSVVNAGMGGEVFQNALKETATAMGTDVDAIIEKQGSFRESLSEGWLTADVLTETLKKFTMCADDMTDAEIEAARAEYKANGYTDEQIDEIFELGKTATEAATKVKTFSQLMDTLKEAAGSGWTQTWEIIVGDFEEARSLWTSVSDTLGAIINESATARNAVLQEWADLGGRSSVIQAIKNVWLGFVDVVKPIKEAFREIFPSITAEQIYNVTKAIENFTAKFKVSDEVADKLKRTFKGVFSVLDIGKKILVTIGKVVGSILGSGAVKSILSLLLDGMAKIGDFLTALDSGFNDTQIANVFTNIVGKISNGIEGFINAIKNFVSNVKNLKNGTIDFKTFISNFLSPIKEGFADIVNNIPLVGKGISSAFSKIKETLSGFGGKSSGFNLGGLSSFTDNLSGTLDTIKEKIKEVFQFFKNNFTISDLLGVILGGGFVASYASFVSTFKSFKDVLSGKSVVNTVKEIKKLFEKDDKETKNEPGIKERFTDLLSSLHDSLKAFTAGIKIASIVAIAAAIAILVGSVKTLSEIPAEELKKSLATIGSLLGMLAGTFAIMNKTLGSKGFSSKGIVKSSVSMVIMAIAIKKLADVVIELSSLSWKEIIKGLAGLGGCIAGMVVSLKLLNGVKIKVTTIIAMIAVAKSLKIMAEALAEFGSMSWGEIVRGLSAMGGALGEMVVTLLILKKIGGMKTFVGAASMVILSKSLDDTAEALKKFGSMSWAEIARGLSAMGGALGEMVIALGVLNQFGAFKSLFSAGSLDIIIKGLDDTADALKKFGSMSWRQIAKGLSAMGGALGEMVIALGVLNQFGAFKSLFSSKSLDNIIEGLDDTADALKKFSSMSWEDIGQGLVAMGGALGEMVIALGVLNKFGAFESLFSSESLSIVIDGLGDVASALVTIGGLEWADVAQGLVGIGGVLGEIGTVNSLVGNLSGFGSIIGAISESITLDSIDKIVEPLEKIGSMSWEEIGKGLSGMGGALAEIGTVNGLVGGIAGFGSIIGAIAESITLDSIDKIVEPLEKIGSMSWEDIAQGLVGMGGALGEVAAITTIDGIFAGLSILGSISMNIASMGLGDIADAFQKFGSMDWESVQVGLAAMAGALAEIALGGMANSFSGIGALSIAALAEPLGTLADSVKKWEGVTVPDNIGVNLAKLALGVSSFTVAGIGTATISSLSTSLGTLADSISKWADVTVPENLKTSLKTISDAVGEFAFTLGASSLSNAAEPLGTLADSVKKWEDVEVPDSLSAQLANVSEGVSQFAFTMGSVSLSNAAEPLGTLADSVKKWEDVEVPEDLSANLADLATGLNSFQFAGGGISIRLLAEPLGTLADSVKKWKNVSMPETLETDLSSLSEGIGQFKWTFLAIENIKNLVTPLGDLADSMKKWNGIHINDSVLNDLGTFGLAIDDLGTNVTNAITNLDTTKMSSFSTELTNLNSAMNKISSVSDKEVSSFIGNVKRLASMTVDASSLETAANDISTSVSEITSSVSGKFTKSQSTITESAGTMMSGVSGAISSSSSDILESVKELISDIVSTIGANKNKLKVSAAFRTIVSGASDAIRSKYDGIVKAGKYLGDGLITGIKARKQSVYDAAYELGKTAVQGEKDGQNSASPSKDTIKAGKWLGEGLIIGMEKTSGSVYKSGLSIGKDATSAISLAMEKLNTSMDATPTITPVINLDGVHTGLSAISNMFGSTSLGVSTSLGTISRIANAREIQNGGNSEVVSALAKLHKDVKGISANNYTIDGITYSSGTEVADAVETLIKAAIMERRM